MISKTSIFTYMKQPLLYYILFPLVLCILFGSFAFSDQLWLDEIFTITEIHLDPLELWDVFSTEVHPPFYFYALMAFCSVFGDSILVMKLFSVLGCLATMLLGVFPVRRAFGEKTAIWFMFLCLTMPFMMRYSVEIRMYSWAIFFVTAALIYALLIIKTSKPLDWGLYFIFGLLGAYTHTYALIAIAVLHAVLGLSLWMKEKKRCLQWLITSGLFVICYLPWVFQLLSQVSGVSNGFWIAPLTISDIVLMPASLFSISNYYLMALLLGVMVILGCMMLYRIYTTRAKGDVEKATLFCLIVPVIVYGISIAFSLIVQPVIQARYLMVMAGFGMLFLALSLSTIKSKKILVAFCILMLVTTGVHYGIIFNQEYPTDGDSLFVVGKNIITNLPDNTILLHAESHSYGVLCYHLPDSPNWYPVADNLVEIKRSTYFGKVPGLIVGITDVKSAIEAGKEIRLISLNDNDIPYLIMDNFKVNLEKEYTSNSPNYPIWKVWSIQSLSNIT